MSSSAQLSQLKAALESVQSYELPDKYNSSTTTTSTTNDENANPNIAKNNAIPLLDKEAIKRYKTARNQYIKQRIDELFLQHLSTYNHNSSNTSSNTTFQFPPVLSTAEEEEIQRNATQVKQKLITTAKDVSDNFHKLRVVYAAFEERKKELASIIHDMEAQHVDEDDETVELDMDIEGEEDENREMKTQEEQLEVLIRRKAELEAKLRSVRTETMEVDARCESLRDKVDQQKKKRQQKLGADKPSNDSMDVTQEYDNLSIEKLKKENININAQASKLQEMKEWYDSIREVMEELGELKILTVAESTSEEHNEEELVVKMQLLDRHVLRIGLGAAALQSSISTDLPPPLRVVKAELVTSSVLTDTMFKYDDDYSYDQQNKENDTSFKPSTPPEEEEQPTVSITIPPLNDLVKLSSSLQPPHDIQFLIRETMSRIRSLSSRVVELGILRTKYLTKIEGCGTTNDKTLAFGVNEAYTDQEIVCTLDKLITVVLKLTPDCPTLPGSVYIDQIVGVGGWNARQLEEVKNTVNKEQCFGPVKLMEVLVGKIERMEREGMVCVPRTPTLPLRRKR